MEARTWLSLAVIVGGLGLGAVALLRPRPTLERAVLVLPLGLGLVAPLLLLMRVLHLPLDLWILLGAGGAAGVFGALRLRRAETPSIDRHAAYPLLAAALLAVLTSAVMVVGATGYPWLEDSDSWRHAAGARFVALHRTTVQPEPGFSQVLEPYPPFYTAFIGALHQGDDDLNQLLKVVNALMVGLSALAAYFASTVLIGSGWRALGAAVVMAVSPSFMGHFIWAQSLGIPAFLVALWALGELPWSWREAGRGELAVAALLVLGATIVQAFTAAVSAVLLAAFVGAGLLRSRMDRAEPPLARVAALSVAGVGSALMWALLARGILQQYSSTPQAFRGGDTFDTSKGLAYGWRDFVWSFSQTMDQGSGLGWATALLAAVGLVALLRRLRKGSDRVDLDLFVLCWLAIALLGVQGNALPVKLFPHRFWVYLAPPVALLAVEGATFLATLLRPGFPRRVAASTLVAGAVLVNAPHRLYMQLRTWPPGYDWAAPAQVRVYVALSKLLPKMTPVLAPCVSEEHLIGLNLDAEPWNPASVALRRELDRQDGSSLKAFMEANHVQVLALDQGCVFQLGYEKAIALLESAAATPGFERVAGVEGLELFFRK